MVQQGEEREETRINRRSMLRAGAGSMFVPALGQQFVSAGSARAADESLDYDKDSQRVIELKISADIESPSEGHVPLSHSDQFVPEYYVDDDRAFIVHSRNSGLTEQSTIVKSPSELVGTSYQEIPMHLPNYADSSFDGFATESYDVVDDDSGHNLDLSISESKAELRAESDERINVNAGESETKQLPRRMAQTIVVEEREIENPRDSGDETLIRKFVSEEGSVPAKPTVTIRDQGELPIFSTSKGMIFPRSMPGADAILYQAEATDLQIKQVASDVVTVKGVQS